MILPDNFKPLVIESCDWKQDLNKDQQKRILEHCKKHIYWQNELNVSTGDERVFMAGPLEALNSDNYGCAMEDFLDPEPDDNVLMLLGYDYFEIFWDSLRNRFAYVLYNSEDNTYEDFCLSDWNDLHNYMLEITEDAEG